MLQSMVFDYMSKCDDFGYVNKNMWWDGNFEI